MTDKKQKILEVALELFANEGFASTATSKISKKARVSEGLIFRHFENKNGLLASIMNNVEQRIGLLFIPIIECSDPKQVIDMAISLPFTIKKTEYNFWRLQFKLKWESAYNNPEKMQPLLDKLAWAFNQLGYELPKLEAQFLVQNMEAVSTEILKGNLKRKNKYKSFLLSKY